MKKNEGSDSLFKLIHGLDANEKGYVKKFLKRTSAKGNVSLKVIQVIEKQIEYDETALKKIFKNYAVVKVHTWESVMDALNIYNKNQSLATELNHLHSKVSILHTKGLIEEAKKLLDKYIQKCKDTEEYHTLIKLLTLRSNLSREFKNPKQDLQNHEIYAEQIQTAMKQLNEIYLFADELMRFYYLQLVYSKDHNFASIYEFQRTSLLSKTKPSSKQALKFQDDFGGGYYHLLQDYSSSIIHLKRSLEFVEKKVEKSGYFDLGLITSSKNLITIYLQLKQYESAQTMLDRFKNYPITNSSYKKIRDADVYHFQLYIFNQSSQLKELKLYLQENGKKITDAIEDYANEHFRNSFQIHYLISLLLIKKYKEAVRWILQCNSNKYFRDSSTSYKMTLLLEIALHFILQDSESATSKAKSILKADFELGDYAPLFKTLTISDETKRTKAISKSIAEVKQLKKSEVEKSYILFRYFDVLNWMEAVL